MNLNPPRVAKIVETRRHRRWPVVREVVLHGRARWRVDGRPYFGREWFPSLAAATDRQLTMRLAVGNDGEGLPLALRVDAGRAWAVVEPLNGTLLEAAKEWAARRQTGMDKVSVVISDWIASRVSQNARAELGRQAVADARWAGKLVVAQFGERQVREVTPAEAQSWVDSLSLGRTGKDMARRQLRAAWNWLARQGRAQANPWISLTLPKAQPAEVSILAPPEVSRLLRACRPSPPVWRYALLGLACGLRPSEAARIGRGDFRHNSVEVKGGKTGGRFFALSLPLWRAFVSAKGQDSGPVFPADVLPGVLRRLWSEAKERSGVRVPPDSLRHSFASYWLPVHHDRAQLAELMGNSPAIIAKHYRRPVPVSTARRFWETLQQEVSHAREIR